jgi:hypothetical protein
MVGVVEAAVSLPVLPFLLQLIWSTPIIKMGIESNKARFFSINSVFIVCKSWFLILPADFR